MTIPIFTIVHSLPDRVRLHFSNPPINFDLIQKQLSKDKRISQITYSDVSHTCVICFEHKKVELLHILKMLTLELADEYNRQPVFIRPVNINRFTLLSQISALSILIALTGRIFQVNWITNAILGWTAVGTTGAAVVEHAYSEIKLTGSFDPEALSIVFLFNSAGSGRLVWGAVFTWLASFSRHLMHVPYLEGLKLTVVEGFDENKKEKYLDVVTSGSISMTSLEGIQ